MVQSGDKKDKESLFSKEKDNKLLTERTKDQNLEVIELVDNLGGRQAEVLH